MNWIAALLLAAPLTHGMAMKPVVCKSLDDAKGKTGADLAQAIEQLGVQFARSNYVMTGMLPGDPVIVCFSSRSGRSKLPMGAR